MVQKPKEDAADRSGLFAGIAVAVGVLAFAAILWAAYEGPRREREAQQKAWEKYRRERDDIIEWQSRIESIRSGAPK